MTLQQLKYIIEIVNCGSMNLAAQKLFVSQPSLSNAVKELEKELGIEIFIRTNKGVTLSSSGQEFLGYARQIIEQTELLEQRYHKDKPARRLLAVSTQHYAFSVNAFVNLIKEYAQDEYDFTLRETKTHEIIDDVKNMRSEIGVLYLSKFNEQVIRKILQENDLCFKELFTANPHVFLSAKHPLAGKKIVTFDDLEPYPCLSFEQGIYNSFYFAEEMKSTYEYKKMIHADDRATMLNLMVGLNGYTLCSGIICEELNGNDYAAVPLAESEKMRIGYIRHKGIKVSPIGELYVDILKKSGKPL